MAAGLVTINIPDAAGTARAIQFWSSDGTVTGTLSPVSPKDVAMATAAAQAAILAALTSVAVTGPVTNSQLTAQGLATQTTLASVLTQVTATVTALAATLKTKLVDSSGTDIDWASPAPVTLNAGENHIGQMGGHIAIAPANFTRSANTTAYASGQLIANSTTAGSVVPLSLTVARANDLTGMIRRLRLKCSSTGPAGATVRVHLYKTSPTCTNGDGGVWLTTESNYLGCCDIVLDKTFSDAVKGFGVPAVGSEFNFDPTTGARTLFALLEARGAIATPGSASVWTLTAEAHQN